MNNYILKHVTIVRPGGNDTAIVWDNIPRDMQTIIAKRIQINQGTIEQVMFAEEQSNGTYRGQMAGGEFCGNATRSLGYLLLNRQVGEIMIEVSGTDRMMTVSVDKHDSVKTSIPVHNKLDSVTLISENKAIVRMDGISFFIIFSENEKFRQSIDGQSVIEQKQNVIKLLHMHGLLKHPASGLLILENNKELHPYVYVRSIDTLYYETGCGSGSTAIALVESIKTGTSIYQKELIQPSGMSLFVTIERDNSRILQAMVEGPISILYDGYFYLVK